MNQDPDGELAALDALNAFGEAGDGGVMDGIVVSNLAMKNVGCPLFIRLGNRARPPVKGMDPPGVGLLRNVTVTGIEASGAGPVGSSITGIPGHCVENVTLSNLRFSFAGGGEASDAPYGAPENEDKYPEHSMFGPLPAYGFFVRHVRNLRLENVEVAFEQSDGRPALLCDDVQGLDIDGFRAQAAPGQPMLFGCRNVRDALIRGCMVGENVETFLRLDGAENRNVVLDANAIPEGVRALAGPHGE